MYTEKSWVNEEIIFPYAFLFITLIVTSLPGKYDLSSRMIILNLISDISLIMPAPLQLLSQSNVHIVSSFPFLEHFNGLCTRVQLIQWSGFTPAEEKFLLYLSLSDNGQMHIEVEPRKWKLRPNAQERSQTKLGQTEL